MVILAEESEDPRVRFAAERTLLAWIRTSIALMGFGFVLSRFGMFLREIAAVTNVAPRPVGPSMVIGVMLTFTGVVVLLSSSWEYWKIIRRINQRLPFQPLRWSTSFFTATLMTVFGIILTFYLIIL